MNYISNTCCLHSIVAIDGQGAQSSALEFNIVQCDGCGIHGECDFDSTVAISDLAKRARCNCQTGFSGITVKSKHSSPFIRFIENSLSNCFFSIFFKQVISVILTQMAAHKTLVH